MENTFVHTQKRQLVDRMEIFGAFDKKTCIGLELHTPPLKQLIVYHLDAHVFPSFCHVQYTQRHFSIFHDVKRDVIAIQELLPL